MLAAESTKETSKEEAKSSLGDTPKTVEKCGICHCPSEKNNPLLSFHKDPPFHFFHPQCYAEWLKTSNSYNCSFCSKLTAYHNIFDNKHRDEMLRAAAADNDFFTCEYLLKNHISIQAKVDALTKAVKNGCLDIIALILNKLKGLLCDLGHPISVSILKPSQLGIDFWWDFEDVMNPDSVSSAFDFLIRKGAFESLFKLIVLDKWSDYEENLIVQLIDYGDVNVLEKLLNLIPGPIKQIDQTLQYFISENDDVNLDLIILLEKFGANLAAVIDGCIESDRKWCNLNIIQYAHKKFPHLDIGSKIYKEFLSSIKSQDQSLRLLDLGQLFTIINCPKFFATAFRTATAAQNNFMIIECFYKASVFSFCSDQKCCCVKDPLNIDYDAVIHAAVAENNVKIMQKVLRERKFFVEPSLASSLLHEFSSDESFEPSAQLEMMHLLISFGADVSPEILCKFIEYAQFGLVERCLSLGVKFGKNFDCFNTLAKDDFRYLISRILNLKPALISKNKTIFQLSILNKAEEFVLKFASKFDHDTLYEGYCNAASIGNLAILSHLHELLFKDPTMKLNDLSNIIGS